MRRAQKTAEPQNNSYVISLDSQAIPRMCSINEASERTGLPDKLIRQLIRSGKVPYIMSGTKYLVNMNRLIDYLNTGDAQHGASSSN